MGKEKRDEWIKEHTGQLTEDFKKIDSEPPRAVHLQEQWKGFEQAPAAAQVWDTGVDVSTLKFIGAKSVNAPNDLVSSIEERSIMAELGDFIRNAFLVLYDLDLTIKILQNVHPHLKKTHCDARVKKLEDGSGLDWATAEALAIGSLLYQGY